MSILQIELKKILANRCTGAEAKRGIEFGHSISNASIIWWQLGNGGSHVSSAYPAKWEILSTSLVIVNSHS